MVVDDDPANLRELEDMRLQQGTKQHSLFSLSRLYLVEGLVEKPRPQDSTLVELSCIEDDAQGQQLGVLSEREIDAAVLTTSTASCMLNLPRTYPLAPG
jgi:hypothetical protein